MQIRSTIVAREFKSDDRPDVYAGIPSIGGVEGDIVNCSKSQGPILNGFKAHELTGGSRPRLETVVHDE